ncbi:hypothetical protein FDUTEX481_02938 [Tolypothrix sp. PCC 7601]|nr:hypothetical protein FDUTEX481_02938 [Tolypothrix sp. PCC 7601]
MYRQPKIVTKSVGRNKSNYVTQPILDLKPLPITNYQLPTICNCTALLIKLALFSN